MTAGTQPLIFRCNLSLCNLTAVRLEMTQKTQICSLEVMRASERLVVTHFRLSTYSHPVFPTHMRLFHILSAGFLEQQHCGIKIHTLDYLSSAVIRAKGGLR